MIKITELANSLVEKCKLSKKEAEFFIPLFIDVLTTGLKKEKQVKIKGLGTFKVTAVSSRESVDVNTGERIVIEGRDKISFIPEPALRERVNAPFEQFETVTISDEVDFSEIDKRHEQLKNAVVQEDIKQEDNNIEQQAEDKQQAAERKQVTHTIMDNTNNEKTTTKEETTTKSNAENKDKEILSGVITEKIDLENTENKNGTIKTDLKQNKEDILTTQQPSLSSANDAIGNPLTKETTISQVLPTISSVTTKEEEVTSNQKGVETKTADDVKERNQDLLYLHKNLQRTQRNQKWLMGVIGFLLLFICIGGYYIGKQFTLRDNRIEHLVAELTVSKQGKTGLQQRGDISKDEHITEKQQNQQHTQQQVNATLAEEQNNANTKTLTVSKDDKTMPTNANNQSIKVSNKPVQNNDYQQDIYKYDADPRIRTGAYIITGVAQTVTVREGQTLSSISKTYLGAGMECYIEALNTKKELKAGDKVKIPALKLKKKK